ncbi:MAG: RNA-directed DNA polymerase [Lachnospiraceae bacterium]|nr:RNA-directed DNA polymerase [Lachnospiraceae bacterium]
MKTYKYLYSQMLDKEIIERAFRKLRKGKTKRKEVIYIDNNLADEIDKMYLMIINTKPEGVAVSDPDAGFKPKRKKPKKIKEHGKERVIYMPDIYEQWMHHIIIQILEPIIVQSAYKYTCGAFPKRGAHYGKKAIKKWIKEQKNTRNFAKLDIRHFYSRIRVEIIMKELKTIIKDDWFLYIIQMCFKGFTIGIPLGFYISQWLANFLLKPLDYFIKIKLKIPHYIRYMDDMVLFSSNKKRLHEAVIEIKKLLGRRYRLKLKKNYQVCKFHYLKKNSKEIGRFLDFMGFVFKRNRITIRESIMLSATRLVRKMFDVKRVYKRHAYAVVSYMGWFKHTDSYNCYLNYIKPFVDIKKMKKIISKTDRRNGINERLDYRKMLTEA